MIARELESFEKKSIERDSRRVSYSEQQTIIDRMSPIDYNLCNFKGKEVLVIVEKEDIPEEIRAELAHGRLRAGVGGHDASGLEVKSVKLGRKK